MKTHNHDDMGMQRMHYWKLLVMMIISFGVMYILMYSMVDTFSNVIPNINQVYMAALMTAAMAIIELALMWHMYKNTILNFVIVGVSLVILSGSFLLIRYQGAVGDEQFLKSMIPHHAAAILMVKEAPASDPQIKELQDNIIKSQQQEIDFMRSKLQELKAK